ncbi:Mdm1p [Sporobolomyces koalae]|uniref:Mdm1p n=1 Tax=Sporobolomyces koalae TaxID=500713 RepID=UPI0031741F7C
MTPGDADRRSWALPLVLLVALVSISSSSVRYYLVLVPLAMAAAVLSVLGVALYLTWMREQRQESRLDAPSGGTGVGRAHQGPVRLHFTSPAAWAMTQTKASWEQSNRPNLVPDAPPALAAAVEELLALVTRTFVLKWYSQMSDSPSFPNAVEQTIADSLVSVSTRVAQVDWSDVLVGRILPLLTAHLDSFRAAAQALGRHDLEPELASRDDEQFDLFLASRYASELKSGTLHPAVDTASPNSRPAEEAWLRHLFGQVLPLVLPEREMDSPAVAIMVREIVACAVMLPIFDMLGDPDFWNRIIDDKAGNAIRDQKMVNQFRQALDQQAPAAVGSRGTQDEPRKTEAISVKTGQRQFDSWLRGISKTRDLADLKRLRSDVTAQTRKAKILIDGKQPEEVVEWVKVSHWIDFIERLYSAKRKIGKRIEELGGITAETRRAYASTIQDPDLVASLRLRDILLDPTSLSYFMEFEERRQRSERVQFWLLVQGLKDPLDDHVEATARDSPSVPATMSDIATEDLRLIWESYLRRDPFQSTVSHLETIRDFVEGPAHHSVQNLRRVRHAVFALQNEVLERMDDEDFPAFVASDLYFKAVANLQPPSSPLLTETALSEGPVSVSRRRSLSNPVRPKPSTVSIPVRDDARQNRSPSPVPPIQLASKSPGLHRTETLPPQITVRDTFDLPPSRKPDAGVPSGSLTSRKTSSGSLDTLQSTASSSGALKKATNLSDSLEFLMASPTPETQNRSPLFDEIGLEQDTTTKSAATAPSPESDEDYIRVETIEAIQDALNSILETNTSNSQSGTSQSRHVPLDKAPSADSRPRGNLPPPRHPSLSSFSTKSVSISSSTTSPTQSSPPPLPLPPPVRKVSGNSTKSLPSRRQKAVFDDGESLEDLEPTEDDEPEFDPQSIQLAAPGDLHLPDEIKRLGASLDKLKSQESVVGALIRKAELTGNVSELKILIKSQDSLRREIRAATFQKDQYENQEAENKLTPNGTRVTIPGTTVGQANGQSFQLYLVEVHQVNPDGSFRSGWIVTRRYSEFASLYAKLRDKFVPARYLDFPGKRIVTSYSKEFIEQRRIGLERYLQALIKIPIVCRSHELRAFLSQQTISLPKSDPSRRLPAGLTVNHGFMRTFYRSVTSGIDDVLGTSTTSMMDTIVERLSQQAAVDVIQAEDLVEHFLGDKANPDETSRIGEEGLTYFTAPICDLFVTVFELREKNNWLRRQAILIVLQQVLGGTIERKFRDSVKMLLAPPQLVSYVSLLKSALWPNGQPKPSNPPRSPAEKLATKESANRKLSALMPDVAANLIGRHNARQGARTLFAILQNKRLLKHLIFSIVDEIIAVMFPEINIRNPASSASASATTSKTSSSRPLFVS